MHFEVTNGTLAWWTSQIIDKFLGQLIVDAWMLRWINRYSTVIISHGRIALEQNRETALGLVCIKSTPIRQCIRASSRSSS